ncbi:hypothetical protein [Polaromonas sp. C04]|uniref:hypothetical protein n=1 Tax=Polaromonas sp. C04 TaxID=1945857 RepID=UPI0009862827|nr:hypothetical protein [Polaromonas sp. C04]OOG53007.1 hypothetical protein B0E49_10970 [Polaromonas sp. C04]
MGLLKFDARVMMIEQITGLPHADAEVLAKKEIMKELEALEAQTEKPLNTRERDTLLRLLIGMAVKGYSHDPAAAKSNAPKEIADDLASLGMSVSDDTVRKYLKQAAETVLPAKPRQS